MRKLEVFYDYTCPFCLRGHELLLELMPQFPMVSIEWHPCEAHPRPEQYGQHSDLCARGLYYAQEQGADLMEYHRKIYDAIHMDHVDIEDLSVVAKLVDGLTDSKLFYESLTKGAYVNNLLENNSLAWGTYEFPAVPSYRMNGKLLKSVPNVGVTKQRLSEFLAENCGEVPSI